MVMGKGRRSGTNPPPVPLVEGPMPSERGKIRVVELCVPWSVSWKFMGLKETCPLIALCRRCVASDVSGCSFVCSPGTEEIGWPRVKSVAAFSIDLFVRRKIIRNWNNFVKCINYFNFAKYKFIKRSPSWIQRIAQVKRVQSNSS